MLRFLPRSLNSMSFEWQTEEDDSWHEEPASPEPPKPGRRRWPWLVLLGLMVVGTAVFLLYRQLNQRIETATNDVAADLVASYAIVQQAAVNHDENLFNSLLSGREPAWAEAQRVTINLGLLFDRPGFGLEWQPGEVETAVFSQTLSPELTAAELTTRQNYSLNIGNGLTQTVQLERVDVYRLGEDRWLLASPAPEFWGIRRRLEGQLLSVRYPARDEEIVHRLAADLEAKLVQLCTVSGYTCPPDAQVRLVFSPEPESLTQATFLSALTLERELPGTIWDGNQAVVLPAPSLVGLPQDETGYGAVLRGYARQLLTIAINDLNEWQCCSNVPFYRAVVTYQLYELGVWAWPLAAVSSPPTAVTLPNDFHLGHGALFWHAPFPETPTDFAQTPAPYVVVDFLVNELHLTPRQIAAILVNYKQFIFEQWLIEVAGPPWTQATLNNAFRQHVAQWQVEPQARPQPDSGLMLLCQDQVHHGYGLYYYDFSLEAPQLLADVAADESLFFVGLPDGSGVAVAAQPSATSQPETYLLRDGDRIEVTWNNVGGLVSRPPLTIPTTVSNGRYLLWTVTPEFATDTFYAVTDLETCQPGDSCEAIPLRGYPFWSPAAEQLLTLTVINPWWTEGLVNGLMLLRQTPTSETINSPGFGASIFWLDEERFGFLTEFQNGIQQIVATDTSLSQRQVLLDNNALRGYFPPDERPRALTIQFVHPMPGSPETFIILAADSAALQSEGTPRYLFWYRPERDVMTLIPLPRSGDIEQQGHRFSPDGRFLLSTTPNVEQSGTHLLLQDFGSMRVHNYELQGETAFPHHFYASWSPDGQWLAIPELGYIRLWHNGRDEQLLAFDHLNCTNAGWVIRIES